VLHEALDWAGSGLGEPVRDHAELTGGLTSTMLALTGASGRQSVLRLVTREPWRSHGAALTSREREAQQALAPTAVPAPTSIALDAAGTATGVAAHLMSRLPGEPTGAGDEREVRAMADLLATIHEVEPTSAFRPYESWAWEAKWVVPAGSRHPGSWRRAFAILAEAPPAHEPTFLHRDFSHRNLLWTGGAITGVVDWVETSIGPAWLDVGHAATNLAVAHGPDRAWAFVDAYEAVTDGRCDPYWLVMDAVGFLPPPGRQPLFASARELAGLDAWLHEVVGGRA
jgi:aminoglycoside phosphotransferase (APT) family kinase protein